ncbi:MAG: hypothetical protein RIM72_09020 [Alphaproteobacteria bacterium]
MAPRPKSGPARRRTQAQQLRKELIRRLPEMLDAAIAAYQRIALTGQSDDPKSFVATHTGAKAALAHIEQIIKLAETALEKEQVADQGKKGEVEAYLSAARLALAADASSAEEDP